PGRTFRRFRLSRRCRPRAVTCITTTRLRTAESDRRATPTGVRYHHRAIPIGDEYDQQSVAGPIGSTDADAAESRPMPRDQALGHGLFRRPADVGADGPGTRGLGARRGGSCGLGAVRPPVLQEDEARGHEVEAAVELERLGAISQREP